MSRQPKEKWCPYCRETVDQWESQRKKYSRRNSASQQKIRSDVKYWFLCPHCKIYHPWYRFEWLNPVVLILSALGVWAYHDFPQTNPMKMVPFFVSSVVVSFIVMLTFRVCYTKYCFRNPPSSE
jgi:hypothetical protein